MISKAKVPIVKFISAYGRFPIDVSLNQTNGLSAQKLILHQLRHLPSLRPLIVVFKAFLAQRGMNEVFTGGLSSYSVVCLVLSFLQLHPKLRRNEVDGMQSNLGVLLLECFELYGRCFNYDRVGISVRDHGYYFNKEDRDWSNPYSSLAICIEDPQDSCSWCSICGRGTC